MTGISYQHLKLILSLSVVAAVVWGCSGKDPGTDEQPSSDPTEIRFKTVGTEYRGESLQHADGQIESRPASSESEAQP